MAMLGRLRGATIEEIVAAIGWQPHTVRGPASGRGQPFHTSVASIARSPCLTPLHLGRTVGDEPRSGLVDLEGPAAWRA